MKKHKQITRSTFKVLFRDHLGISFIAAFLLVVVLCGVFSALLPEKEPRKTPDEVRAELGLSEPDPVETGVLTDSGLREATLVEAAPSTSVDSSAPNSPEEARERLIYKAEALWDEAEREAAAASGVVTSKPETTSQITDPEIAAIVGNMAATAPHPEAAAVMINSYAYESLADVPEKLPEDCISVGIVIDDHCDSGFGERTLATFKHPTTGYDFKLVVPDATVMTDICRENGYGLVGLSFFNPNDSSFELYCFAFNLAVEWPRTLTIIMNPNRDDIWPILDNQVMMFMVGGREKDGEMWRSHWASCGDYNGAGNSSSGEYSYLFDDKHIIFDSLDEDWGRFKVRDVYASYLEWDLDRYQNR